MLPQRHCATFPCYSSSVLITLSFFVSPLLSLFAEINQDASIIVSFCNNHACFAFKPKLFRVIHPLFWVKFDKNKPRPYLCTKVAVQLTQLTVSFRLSRLHIWYSKTICFLAASFHLNTTPGKYGGNLNFESVISCKLCSAFAKKLTTESQKTLNLS